MGRPCPRPPPPKTIVERVPPINLPGVGVAATGGSRRLGGPVGASDSPWVPGNPIMAYIASWSPGGGDLA